MPGNVAAASPTVVMPAQLARAFSEDLRLEALVNAYPDGSTDRAALANNVRHYFKMTQGLTAAGWQQMYNFFLQQQSAPFYFYNLRETVPPWSWDSTGQSTVGRYTVVFDGQWSDQFTAARTSVQMGLREVV
jgi:hypothetical protein